MVQELEQYEKQHKQNKNPNTKKMLDLMENYYGDLKKEVGIAQETNCFDDDNELENILNQLKPNTTASNFKEFLDIKGNCNRTQSWRFTARQVGRRTKT